MDAADIIDLLGLRPHPEGGHFVETWRAAAMTHERPAGTAIYYLLQAGERSHWHRIDAAEAWHHYAGAALALSVAAGSGEVEAVRHLLGPDLAAGQRPQVVVAPGDWQSAESTGAWTLVGCTVAPGFRFEGFELAPPGWEPGRGR